MTVPGAVAGWEALRTRFGTLPIVGRCSRRRSATPTMGFRSSDIIAARLGGARRQAGGRRRTPRTTYLPDGRAPRAGEVFRNPDLAALAAADRRRGPRRLLRRRRPRSAILAVSREHGGTMTAADLAEFAAGVGRPDLDDLSRLDGLRAAAEHAGHRGAGDAQPDGAVSAGASTASTAPKRCT